MNRAGLLAILLFLSVAPGASADPEVVKLFLQKGRDLMKQGDAEGALDWFTRAANQAPKNPSVRVSIGEAHEQRGAIGSARAAYWTAYAILQESGQPPTPATEPLTRIDPIRLRWRKARESYRSDLEQIAEGIEKEQGASGAAPIRAEIVRLENSAPKVWAGIPEPTGKPEPIPEPEPLSRDGPFQPDSWKVVVNRRWNPGLDREVYYIWAKIPVTDELDLPESGELRIEWKEQKDGKVRTIATRRVNLKGRKPKKIEHGPMWDQASHFPPEDVARILKERVPMARRHFHKGHLYIFLNGAMSLSAETMKSWTFDLSYTPAAEEANVFPARKASKGEGF